eukprot:scaffold34054_cov19-Tisochrysis_lutea.AAC.1
MPLSTPCLGATTGLSPAQFLTAAGSAAAADTPHVSLLCHVSSAHFLAAAGSSAAALLASCSSFRKVVWKP